MRAPTRLFAAALFQSLLGNCAYYNWGGLNNIEPLIQQFITNSTGAPDKATWLWSLASSACQAGYCIAAILLGFFADKLGRKNTVIIVKNIILIISCLCQFVAPLLNTVILLILGRLLAGMAITCTWLLPVFLAECSPPKHRGLMSAFASVGTSLWVIVGLTFGLPGVLGRSQTWHYVFLVPIIPALIHLSSAFFIPESPKYLYLVRKDEKAFEKSVEFYRGSDAKISDMRASLNKELEMTEKSGPSVGWLKILTTRHYRWPFLMSMLVFASIPLGGADLTSQYSTQVMLSLGLERHTVTLLSAYMFQGPAIVLILLGSFLLVDRFGRKTLLLTGMTVNIAGLILLFCTYFSVSGGSAAGIMSILGFLLLTGGNCTGPFTMGPFLPAEMCPAAIRSKAVAAGIFVDGMLSFVTIFSFPPLLEAIGTMAVVPLIALDAVCFLGLVLFLPETKDKSVDMVVAKWMKDDEKPLLEGEKEEEEEEEGKRLRKRRASFRYYGPDIQMPELPLLLGHFHPRRPP